MSPTGPEILVVEVGPERYGLPVSHVQELSRVVSIVPLPLGPSGVEGVVNLRGRVIPVLDLRCALRLSAKDVDLTDHLVFVRWGASSMALRVDRAAEIVAHDGSTVAMLADGRLAPVLDLERLLGDAERALPAIDTTGPGASR